MSQPSQQSRPVPVSLRTWISLSLALCLALIISLAVSGGQAAAPASETPQAPGALDIISQADPSRNSATAGALMQTKNCYSADGRFVVFESGAENLVPGQIDSSGGSDIFLRDRISGETFLVSHAANSTLTAANDSSQVASISGDGRWVVYWSFASDIVAGQNDTNISAPDVFLYDRTTATNTLVSHIPGAPATTGNSNSYDPAVSFDGRFVAFTSAAEDLAAGQTSGGAGANIFVWDRMADSITLVTHASSSAATTADGTSFNPVWSADSNYLTFMSNAGNLVAGQTEDARRFDIFLWHRATNTSVLVSHAADSATTAGNGSCNDPVISADGSFVVFMSAATNLIAAQVDPNREGFDIFIYHRATGTNSLISHTQGATNTTGSARSAFPSISGSGEFVVFQSNASDLVAQDLNNNEDIFVWHRLTGANALVSRSASSLTSASSNARSFGGRTAADGRTIVFSSYSTDLVANQDASSNGNVFLFDRTNNSMRLMSHTSASFASGGNGQSFLPLISADGAHVAFNSQAGDLVAQDANSSGDVFFFERANGALTAASSVAAGFASLTPNGHSGAARASADGRFVVFGSEGTNLAVGQIDANNRRDIFLHDRVTGTTTLVSHAAGQSTTTGDGLSDAPVISTDGRWIAYASQATDLVDGVTDLNAGADIFLYDRLERTTRLVSRSSLSLTTTTGNGGGSETPSMSADGRFVAYASAAADLVAGQSDVNAATDIFVFDRTNNTNTLVSRASASATTAGTDYSFAPGISADGNFIAFYSAAINLVAGQDNADGTIQHCFLYHRANGTNMLIDRASGQTTATGDGNAGSTLSEDVPILSADGRFIAFVSASTNLLANQTDANGDYDIFLFDRMSATNELVSHRNGSLTTTAGGYAINPAMSADASVIGFRSNATDIVAGQTDTNTFQDVFLYERATKTNALLSHAFGHPATTGNSFSGDAVRIGNPSVSLDGRFVAFVSTATDLIADYVDTNGGIGGDVFLFDRASGQNVLLSHAPGLPNTTGAGASGDSQHQGFPAWSADGRHLVFGSRAADFVAGDFNNREDVFLFTVNFPPLAQGQTLTTPEDTPLSIALAASDEDGDTLTYTVETRPTNGALSGSAPNVTYTPNANYHGSDSFTFRASDGTNSSNLATVSINVTPVNDPPQASDDAATVNQNSAANTLDVLSNDTTAPDAGETLTVQWITQSTNGTVAITNNGADLSYTPAAGFSGTDTFTYTASDGNGGVATANVTVTVIAAGLQYYPLPRPLRLLDTRAGQPACDAPGAPLTGGSERTQSARVTCDGITIPQNAQAVVGNATIANNAAGSAAGFATLYPSGIARPTASNLNYTAGQIVPNAFTVGLGSNGAFQIYTSSTTDFIADVTGYYAPPSPAGLYYHALPRPLRLLDTRAGQPACDAPGQTLTGGQARTEQARVTCGGLTIPASAKAIVGNATVINDTGGQTPGNASFVTLYPSGVMRPTASNLNYTVGQIVPNGFTVALGTDGAFNIYATEAINFIVDVTGYYSDQVNDTNGAGLFYFSLATPLRLLDTRAGQPACDAPGAPLTGGVERTQQARVACAGVTIPNTAQAIAGNATVVNDTANAMSGFVTLYPSGVHRPTVSNLNYVPGQIVPNAFTVGVGTDGAFKIYSTSSINFIVDVAGFFAP